MKDEIMNKDVYLKDQRLRELKEKIHDASYMEKAIRQIASDLTVFLYKS
jgi:hypothetical protein